MGPDQGRNTKLLRNIEGAGKTGNLISVWVIEFANVETIMVLKYSASSHDHQIRFFHNPRDFRNIKKADCR